MVVAIILLTLLVRRPADPALSQADRVPEADAAAGARAQGDPAPLQGRPGQDPAGDQRVLQGARGQPGVGLPAAHPPARPAHPDVHGVQGRAPELRPEPRC